MARQVLIVAAAIFALGCLDGLYAKQEQMYAQYEQHKALEKKATVYAAVISHCANGGRFTIEDHTEVLCKQRPLKLGAGL